MTARGIDVDELEKEDQRRASVLQQAASEDVQEREAYPQM